MRRAPSEFRSGFPVFAIFCFASRNEPDSALPPSVYRAPIESLFKGAVGNSVNVLAYVALAGYLFWTAAYLLRRPADRTRPAPAAARLPAPPRVAGA